MCDGSFVSVLRNAHHRRGDPRQARASRRARLVCGVFPRCRRAAPSARARRDGVASRAQRRTRLVVRASARLSRGSREVEGLDPHTAVSRDARTWSRAASTDQPRGDFEEQENAGEGDDAECFVWRRRWPVDDIFDRIGYGERGTIDDRGIAVGLTSRLLAFEERTRLRVRATHTATRAARTARLITALSRPL